MIKREMMRSLVLVMLASMVLSGCRHSTPVHTSSPKTVCNPMDLSYRFRPETNEVSRREAADPTVVWYKGEYWLFASKSGGYWHSTDLTNWQFVLSNQIPTEDYAPTVVVMRDTLFMAVSSKSNNKIYKTSDPESGHWVSADTLLFAVEDPCLFLDTDQKFYLYWGCSDVNPLYGAEIDPHSFQLKSDIQELIFPNPAEYGWEVRGDYNTEYDNAPWLEGCWMNKYNGRYYLQYSAPGTREKSYSDGVYVADSPLGPYRLGDQNPFAGKPEGFACGAGHGSTFTDAYGNYWHVGTISVSVKHKFERRIGFYPAFFDDDSVLYSLTKYGDYPIIVPDKKIQNPEAVFPGWMLLSYQKQVRVSSGIDGFKAANMVDENIRTYWAAATGDSTEWAEVDLGQPYDVYAIQVNFAEHETHLYGRTSGSRFRYIVEGSADQKEWVPLVDQSLGHTDNSHQYFQLDQKSRCRYIRFINREVPDGSLALSGLRVFGLGNGQKPDSVTQLSVVRDLEDRRKVSLSWNKSENAVGYNISFGTSKEKLYQNYLVYGDTAVTVRSLNANRDYYFAIEAFNENGITQGVQKGESLLR
jgi:hypothetical protein